MNKGIVAVIGAQYGSEGKGVVVHRMAMDRHYQHHVRVGGPNAGHSFIHHTQKYVVQSIPVGFVDPDSILVLGAGAVINPRILKREIEELEKHGHLIRHRLLIDANATVLHEEDEYAEGHTSGELHRRIGSTGEGVGAARHRRMRRDKIERATVFSCPEMFRELGHICDTVSQLSKSGSILLEGSQGSGLSLTHGPWPYCTSADTNAAQLCADAGVPPMALSDVMLVARTFPIRVAGNSGPLHHETNWEDISLRLARPVEERTTVTKKVRRIGHWDQELYERAVLMNGPRPSVALTFMDYVNPSDQFVTRWEDLSRQASQFILDHIGRLGERLKYVGTGVHPEKGWIYVQT